MLRRNKSATPIYILYLCNEWKEWSSMKLATATTEPDKIRNTLRRLIKRQDVEYNGQPQDLDSLEPLSLNHGLSYAFISAHEDGALEI